ncbi:MAG: RNA 3'-terminal phosphate cyclase, partial [Desulfocapsaceae bacterium]|nr:RNA 3'-terminal phosphate cyclase [Desulfocapsaceae bacterium]
FRPALETMGILFSLELLRWGWYPKGGGEVKARIRPTSAGLRPFRAPDERANCIPMIRVLAASSRLPGHIRARLAARIKDLLSAKGIPSEIEEVEGDAVSPGCMLFCSVCKPGCYGGFTGMGERGRPAEAVAEDVFHGIYAFLDSRATVDERLSDQLILPALLAEGVSIWTTSRLTGHLRTVAWVAGEFGFGPVEFYEPGGRNVTVIVHGRPLH